MKSLKGLYIEDDFSNVLVQQAIFEVCDADIIIEGLEKLPENLDEYYPIVIRDQIDFLIIDHELEKQTVAYKGCDVLNEIRKHDRTIYAILLTNYPLADYKEELGVYDYQLTKGEIKEKGKIEEIVQKIRRACELRCDNKILAEMEQRKKEKEELIDELKRFTMVKKE
jgi:hypothetical protein